MGEGQHDGVGAVRCRAVVLASGGLGQVFSQTTNPAGRDRRRDGAGLPGRRGAARPGVRAVPPDRDVARPRLARPAAADLRGGPRRGRVPRRLGGQPVHAGRPRAGRPGAPRRRRQGDHPADDRDRPPAHVARCAPPRASDVLGEAVPDHPGDLPAARRRPGHRADPGRARLPLRLGRRRDRPLGALHACPASTPPARSPARGCTAPTGWPPTRCSRAWSSRAASPRCCPASCGRGATRRVDRRPAGPRRRRRPARAPGGDDRAGRRAAHRGRARPPRSSGSTSSPAPPAAAVGQDAWEATNLVTVSTLLAEAALLREETRGSHWREDFPERDDATQSGHHDWWIADGGPTGRSGRRRRPTPYPTRCRHERRRRRPPEALLEELRDGRRSTPRRSSRPSTPPSRRTCRAVPST